jgi:hypothetical protein
VLPKKNAIFPEALRKLWRSTCSNDDDDKAYACHYLSSASLCIYYIWSHNSESITINPHIRDEETGTEKWRSLLQVTQPMSSRTYTWTRPVLLSPSALPFCHISSHTRCKNTLKMPSDVKCAVLCKFRPDFRNDSSLSKWIIWLLCVYFMSQKVFHLIFPL